MLSKRDELHNLLASTDCKLVRTETWLNSTIEDTELSSIFPEFNIFRHDRESKRGGGVLIAFHHSLSCKIINITSPLEILFVLCTNLYPQTVIGVCYRPPDADASFSIRFHEALQKITLPFAINLLGRLTSLTSQIRLMARLAICVVTCTLFFPR